jgi:hypothetical protein
MLNSENLCETADRHMQAAALPAFVQRGESDIYLPVRPFAAKKYMLSVTEPFVWKRHHLQSGLATMEMFNQR